MCIRDRAADVVKRIFAMTIDGYGPYQIASKLKSEKVLIPSAYLCLLYTSFFLPGYFCVISPVVIPA